MFYLLLWLAASQPALIANLPICVMLDQHLVPCPVPRWSFPTSDPCSTLGVDNVVEGGEARTDCWTVSLMGGCSLAETVFFLQHLNYKDLVPTCTR